MFGSKRRIAELEDELRRAHAALAEVRAELAATKAIAAERLSRIESLERRDAVSETQELTLLRAALAAVEEEATSEDPMTVSGFAERIDEVFGLGGANPPPNTVFFPGTARRRPVAEEPAEEAAEE